MSGELERVERPDMSAVADIARDAVAMFVDDFRRPSFRAGFGAALLTTAMLARAGARPGLAVFVSLMVGAAVEKLYAMTEDIHETSLAQRDYLAVLREKAAGNAPSKV